jgi:hypothetical protein
MRAAHIPRWPVVLAVLALVLGTAWAWLGGIPFTREPIQVCTGYGAQEATSSHTELSFWPPGAIDCRYTRPGGATGESTFMPWMDYLSVALFAATVGLGAFACSWWDRRSLVAVAVASLFGVAGFFAAFI